MRATKNIVYATLIHFSSGHEMFYSLYFSSKILSFYENEKKGISFINKKEFTFKQVMISCKIYLAWIGQFYI